jgi:protein-S-isoprenylcysteine O-methyltransferase Ste14
MWFGLMSIPLLLLSWRGLKSPRNHGFYRFFLWESVLALFMLNVDHWFTAPFAWHQLISWLFLLFSLYLVLDAVRQLSRSKRSLARQKEEGLYDFEATAELVETGIYRYIRHPMYSSLLFLAWGIALKNPERFPLWLALLATAFCLLTCQREEKANLSFFGAAYQAYRKRTKWLIPFIF